MPKSYTNNNKHNYHKNMPFELNNQNKTKYKCSYSQKQLKSPGNQSEPEKPNFELSGKLAAESNHINGIPLKYYEPSEAHKPDKLWQLYVFKNDEQTFLILIKKAVIYLEEIVWL